MEETYSENNILTKHTEDTTDATTSTSLKDSLKAYLNL